MTEEQTAGQERRDGALIVRLARPEEMERASDLIRAAYAEYAESMRPERWERYIENAADVASRSQDAELFVAELDGRLVGTVTYYPSGDRSVEEGWPSDWAGIRLLGVAPEARGVGAGRALIEALINRARAQTATAIALHTTERMAIARAMYERMGFLRVPEYDFGVSSGRSVLAYRLDL